MTGRPKWHEDELKFRKELMHRINKIREQPGAYNGRIVGGTWSGIAETIKHTEPIDRYGKRKVNKK